MGFFKNILVMIGKDLLVDFYKWASDTIMGWWARRKKMKQVDEGLKNGDSEKVEEAIESNAGGKLSGLPGSKVRPRRTRN